MKIDWKRFFPDDFDSNGRFGKFAIRTAALVTSSGVAFKTFHSKDLISKMEANPAAPIVMIIGVAFVVLGIVLNKRFVRRHGRDSILLPFFVIIGSLIFFFGTAILGP